MSENSNRKIRMLVFGFVLIELLIAMSVGILIVGMLFATYIASEKNDRLQIALNRIQDNANNAISFLNNSLHQAGYVGCARLGNNFAVIPYQHYSLDTHHKLTGHDSEFIVRFMSEISVLLQKPLKNPSILYLGKETKFSSGDILLISNFHQTKIF